jgi:ribosomal protein S18 acetylase RimI-like enzyme
MIEIKLLSNRAQKETYRNLLLDADPSWDMVCKYLDGDMYVLYCDGQPAAEAVVFYRVDLGMPELKNISVSPKFRRKGLAQHLIRHLQTLYSTTADAMCVGTCTISDAALRLYTSCGFSPWFVEKNFFIDNYPQPIFEDNGLQCVDMQYLRCNFSLFI